MYSKYQNVDEENMEVVEFLIQALSRITKGSNSNAYFSLQGYILSISMCLQICY